jgi:RIO kinase 1
VTRNYSSKYEHYEALFDPTWAQRQTPRLRPKAKHVVKKSASEMIAEMTDEVVDVQATFETTYRPSRYEEGYLLSSLASFYDKGLITDVLSLVKGGKEANVYCCEAHPATGLGLLAAKVYRPRMFRNLRNDKMYQQGREVLTADGRPAGKEAGRIARAIRNKSGYGMEAAHTSWLMHEFVALERLYQAGAAVPRPLAGSDNAVLMTYHGDEGRPAPTLNSVSLEPAEAKALFAEVLRNVELMLQHEMIHGDLSAYNILYWARPGGGPGQITIIDFPQVVNLHSNPKARFVLRRDIERTCEYFEKQGVRCNPRAIADGMWARYTEETDPEDLAADWSRLVEMASPVPGG